MGVTQEGLRPLLLTAILREPPIPPQPHCQLCASASVPTTHFLGTTMWRVMAWGPWCADGQHVGLVPRRDH